MDDLSNGYDAIAEDFMAARSQSGQVLVAGWAARLPPGASIIDIGAGHGEPLTTALVECGLDVWAIDASPRLVQAFRRRFPDIDIACEPAETSTFFHRSFDAALAVGLMFLLPEADQRQLIKRVAKALTPKGRFLFSSPWQTGDWDDVLTGRRSLSLGRAAYRACLNEAGLHLIAEHTDDGGSHYFEARKIEA